MQMQRAVHPCGCVFASSSVCVCMCVCVLVRVFVVVKVIVGRSDRLGDTQQPSPCDQDDDDQRQR